MRPHLFVLAVLSLAGLSAAIVAGGHALTSNEAAFDPSSIEVPDESDIPPMTDDEPSAAGSETPAPATGGETAAPAEQPEEAAPPSGGQTPPAPKSGELERVAPRAPLSELGLALPPKPVKPADPGERKAATLYQPVASSAGQIEAKGYSIDIAGVEPVAASEECSFEGTSWPCGARARTAFRSWLRGRAVTCAVPAQPEDGVISTDCRVGRDDVGAWLVENGWARAAAGGPYAEAAEKAEAGKKGIFGPPPARVSVTISPDSSATSALPAPLPPPSEAPAVEPVAPEPQAPVVPGPFPPAPNAPSVQ
jgi:endonuclease YncB( thermonuclease family)